MLWFESDYTGGAHPEVLQHLVKTNGEPCTGYGNDPYCASAAARIREACGCPEGQVYFLVGGTQTNLVTISSILKPWEGVLAAQTGHISVHEAGAIENAGHKVLTLPGHAGKLDVDELRRWLDVFNGDDTADHMVYPGMVYISWPSESGTLYSLAELEALRAVCTQHGLWLYIDGARLGYGLYSDQSDVTLQDIARLADAFYIGGTKVGALCGEALVFPRRNAPAHFFTMVKQKGAVLAKGRLTGVQYDALFSNDLYERISRHVLDMAGMLREAFLEKGYPMAWDSPTNQQFVVLTDEKRDELRKYARFETWKALGNGSSICRFVTAWATTEADIASLRTLL